MRQPNPLTSVTSGVLLHNRSLPPAQLPEGQVGGAGAVCTEWGSDATLNQEPGSTRGRFTGSEERPSFGV